MRAQVPMHVWESKCRACYGTGSVQSSTRRGKRSSGICPSCTGVGARACLATLLLRPCILGEGRGAHTCMLQLLSKAMGKHDAGMARLLLGMPGCSPSDQVAVHLTGMQGAIASCCWCSALLDFGVVA